MDKQVCIYDGCETLIHASGLCGKHYKKVWRELNVERSRAINRKSDTARRADGRRKLTERKALVKKWNG